MKGKSYASLFGEANAGEVDVIYGSSSGLSLAHPAQRWNQTNAFPKATGGGLAGSRFGSSLTAWNFGRDEKVVLPNGFTIPIRTADLAIGLPFQAVNRVSGAGAVDVMYGSFASNGPTGLSVKGIAVNNTFFNAPTTILGGLPLGAQAGAHFGAALY